MANQYGHTVKDGIVYDKNGKYLGHEDIVYGGNKGGTIAPNTSEATANAQPSKTMNGGSAKIDGANPSSPSTNPATRREEYALGQNQGKGSTEYNSMLDVLSKSSDKNGIIEPTKTTTDTTPLKTANPGGVDLTIKGNFDVYNPIDWQNQPEVMQQYYVQANNDIKESRRTLSQLMLQQDALESKSSNVNQVTTLIDAIENAYDRGVFDAETIAKTLGVDVNTVKLIQQGKANELVKLDQEYVQDKLKSYYRAEEDYDINLQRTMEDYNLAKTRLDDQYNSAMQTLRRNLFDDKRAASVGSAVAGISGSEYAVRVIEAKHQQNMDDLEGNYLYSSIQQKYSYTRAIEDYNKNIQRLSEDFDDSFKDIQASVLQQFQEIDNKIGLTTEQLAKAYGTLQQNVLAAKSTATTNYLEALANNENGLADAIANAYGMDTSALGAHNFTAQELGRTWNETIGNATNNIGHILASNDGTRVGTYKSPNGYTYNVYATRDEGLQATVGLLQRAYYGMTLEDAAQKWIGKGKDISAAKKVIQGLGLDLKSTLSDANVEKFITAMGRWEGTLGKNETLEQWLAGGKNLSSYSTETTGTGGAEEGGTTAGGNYIKGYEKDYRNWIDNGSKGFTKSAQDNLTKIFGSFEEFVKNAEAYKPVVEKEDQETIYKDLQQVDTIIKEYTEATKGMTDAEIDAAFSGLAAGGLTALTTRRMVNDKLVSFYSRYGQWIAQGFIDTLVASKKEGATYGALTDREGEALRNAFTPTSLNQSRSEFLRLMGEARDSLREYYESKGGEFKTEGKAINRKSPQILTSITNPSAGAAENVFTAPGRGDTTQYQSTLTGGVYQTVMPK